MKTGLLLVAILTSIFSTIEAQIPEFGPEGAKWWFTEDLADGPPQANYLFSVEGDTIIDGTTYKQLFQYRIDEIAGTTATMRELYFRQDEGNVLFYNPLTLIDEPYFDFSAEVGDTIKTFAQNTGDDFVFDNYINLIINSISDTIISGYTFKQFHYDIVLDTSLTEFPDISFTTTFCEIIGPIGYLIPLYLDGSFFDGPRAGPLKCYEDPDLGLVKFIEEECDYLETNINELIGIDSPIYPNPSSDKIYFKYSSQEPLHINLIDITGKEFNLNLTSDEHNVFEVDVSFLPTGIYLVKIFAGALKVGSQKLVKQ